MVWRQSRSLGTRRLFFIGNHLEGIGVKDCARAGLDVTEKVLAAPPLHPTHGDGA